MCEDDDFPEVQKNSSMAEEIIYNAFSKERTIYLYGEIDENMELVTNRMIERLLQKGKEPIHLRISSVGGDFWAGASICSAIESAKKDGVSVISWVYGKTISMAVPISVCASERYGQKYSTFMLHNPSTFMMGFVSGEQLHRASRDMHKISDVYKEIILKNTQMTEEMFDDIFRKDDEYNFFSDEALKLGFIDNTF